MADIGTRSRVLEAGAGSGALSCWLLRAVGETGLLVSYERPADFADIARANVERSFGGPHPAWQLRLDELGAHDATDGQPSTGWCSTCWRPGIVSVLPPVLCRLEACWLATSPP